MSKLRISQIKGVFPVINKNNLKHRLFQLKKTARKGSSKILRLKSGHCMLNGHNSQMNLESFTLFAIFKLKEGPSH